jgi:hypothetical protein
MDKQGIPEKTVRGIIYLKPEPFDLDAFATLPFLQALSELTLRRSSVPNSCSVEQHMDTKNAVTVLQLSLCALTPVNERLQKLTRIYEHDPISVLDRTHSSEEVAAATTLFKAVFRWWAGPSVGHDPDDMQKKQAFRLMETSAEKLKKLGYEPVAAEVTKLLVKEGFLAEPEPVEAEKKVSSPKPGLGS